MPIVPPPTGWSFPRPRPEDDDLITFGADLEPSTLLSAYVAGLFPMPVEPHALPGQHGEVIGWWSPARRGVLPLEGLRVSRSLRQSCRKYDVSVDEDFAGVIDGCADRTRPDGWITGAVRDAYVHLHELGWAHSVETRRDGELVGGLYGVAIGGLFAGESMFSRATDASKVALVSLVELMSDGLERVLDVQWQTPHLASLGTIEIDREDYLARLAEVLATPMPAAFA